MRFAKAGLIAGLALLAACAETGAPPATVAAVSATAPAQEVRPARPPFAPRPRTKPQVAAAVPETGSRTPGTLVPAPLPVEETDTSPASRPADQPTGRGDVQASDLVGLDPEATAKLLGRPTDTAEDPPALRWRYVGRGCVLTVYFFMDVASRDFRALSYKMSGQDDAHDAPPPRCFADLVAQGWNVAQP
ncbi:MAG TPA: hypothetical protein VEY95_01700 [Azospirillaceae bacterium]|nr:hypothetical protein [Azospirillaceae bacterium]